MQRNLRIIVLVAMVVLLCFVAMQVMAAESAVTLKKLPKAVRATLLAKAKGGKILEIEKNVTKGVVTYSADVAFGKKIFDIEVAANGKFIGKSEDKPAVKAKAKGKAATKPAAEEKETGA